jgi:glucose-1-phosphate cytidylyltransferase
MPVTVRFSPMKVAILAGGAGTRLAEETSVRPKPMVEIGGQPILWHILKHYSHHGFNDFVIALGYKGEYIKRWMQEYATMGTSMTVRPAPARSCGTSPSPSTGTST